MKLKQIILEYDRSKTVSRLFDKLVSASKAQGTFYRTLKSAYERRNQELTDNELTDSVMQFLEDADPTANKQYTQWLAGQYSNRKFRIEDVDRVKSVLENFIKYRTAIKRTGKSVDINQYDFYTLQDLIDKITGEDSDAGIRKNYEYENEMRFLSRTVAGELVVPLTQRASCELGRGTRWCTAAQNNNLFDNYNSQGPLFIWIDPNGDKYQFWFSSDLREPDEYSGEYWQLMDSSDRPLWEYAPDKLKEFVYQNTVTSKLFRNYESKILEIQIDALKRDIGMQYAKEVLMKPWPVAVIQEHPELLPLDKYIDTMPDKDAFDYLINYINLHGISYSEADTNNLSVIIDTWDLKSARHLFRYSPVNLLTELVYMPVTGKSVERAATWLRDIGDDPAKIITEKIPTVAEFVKTLPDDILDQLNLLKDASKREKIITAAILTGTAAGIQNNAVTILMQTILSVKHEHNIGNFRFYNTENPFDMTITYEITARDLGKLFKFYNDDEQEMYDDLSDSQHQVWFYNKLEFKEPNFNMLVEFDQTRAHQTLRDLMKEIPIRKKS